TTCSGTAFLYLEVINGGTSQVMLAASPAVKVVSWKGFPGATLCFPALLTSKGWLAFTTIGVAPHSKRTLSIPSAKVPFPLPKGPVVLALACE
ncbi:MAG TPA: hypothetical protein VNG31_01055, partial [Candidatus Baltobacteraceae bacterium]|nr:hypothetical protein [Candidatus Baltobacteraceae bacterium]